MLVVRPVNSVVKPPATYVGLHAVKTGREDELIRKSVQQFTKKVKEGSEQGVQQASRTLASVTDGIPGGTARAFQVLMQEGTKKVCVPKNSAQPAQQSEFPKKPYQPNPAFLQPVNLVSLEDPQSFEEELGQPTQMQDLRTVPNGSQQSESKQPVLTNPKPNFPQEPYRPNPAFLKPVNSTFLEDPQPFEEELRQQTLTSSVYSRSVEQLPAPRLEEYSRSVKQLPAPRLEEPVQPTQMRCLETVSNVYQGSQPAQQSEFPKKPYQPHPAFLKAINPMADLIRVGVRDADRLGLTRL